MFNNNIIAQMFEGVEEEMNKTRKQLEERDAKFGDQFNKQCLQDFENVEKIVKSLLQGR